MSFSDENDLFVLLADLAEDTDGLASKLETILRYFIYYKPQITEYELLNYLRLARIDSNYVTVRFFWNRVAGAEIITITDVENYIQLSNIEYLEAKLDEHLAEIKLVLHYEARELRDRQGHKNENML